ncbi:Uncharacterized conserved protein, DUF433 family [Desulfurobacterium pacificum]|uniref:Uncharacterized conserved protein, DUF433 family n=1 Tax=Desulfurobacterium pacificum TaxID=240166 RepID=A0ABY1NN11_9BACT|nr:DUF433 domain-containing protein [Desulfurobacterium pacificum]SMP14020.1 Uncharacterized conserved protein, DUF433 family [Desulfurobacterium pacificum]
MNYKGRIVRDPKILGGKPVIKGTRIPVNLILERLSEGVSCEELLKMYPTLEKEDIMAAIACSADVIKKEVLVEY